MFIFIEALQGTGETVSILPKKMRQDFIYLLSHLRCGSPISESSRFRLIEFILKNLPDKKITSSELDKLDHYDLVQEALNEGHKTGNSFQSDSAFYIAANNSRTPVGEATVKNHYYEMKNCLVASDDAYSSVLRSAHPMPSPPDDYFGPVIYVEGWGFGEDRVKKESKIITYAGVFMYNQDTQLSEKIRDANESDLSLLSDVNSHMVLDGDDTIK